MSTCDHGKTAPDIFYCGRSGTTLFLSVHTIFNPCSVGLASRNRQSAITWRNFGRYFRRLIVWFQKKLFYTRRIFLESFDDDSGRERGIFKYSQAAIKRRYLAGNSFVTAYSYGIGTNRAVCPIERLIYDVQSISSMYRFVQRNSDFGV